MIILLFLIVLKALHSFMYVFILFHVLGTRYHAAGGEEAGKTLAKQTQSQLPETSSLVEGSPGLRHAREKNRAQCCVTGKSINLEWNGVWVSGKASPSGADFKV